MRFEPYTGPPDTGDNLTANLGVASQLALPHNLKGAPQRGSKMNNRTNSRACVHKIKCLVDLLEPHRVRDHLVDIDFP